MRIKRHKDPALYWEYRARALEARAERIEIRARTGFGGELAAKGLIAASKLRNQAQRFYRASLRAGFLSGLGLTSGIQGEYREAL